MCVSWGEVTDPGVEVVFSVDMECVVFGFEKTRHWHSKIQSRDAEVTEISKNLQNILHSFMKLLRVLSQRNPPINEALTQRIRPFAACLTFFPIFPHRFP
jgi:hypothetical protein